MGQPTISEDEPEIAQDVAQLKDDYAANALELIKDQILSA
jgi:hypothetical protein